jgi:hypothetical protein
MVSGCCGGGSCQCYITNGDGIAPIEGRGASTDPYVISPTPIPEPEPILDLSIPSQDFAGFPGIAQTMPRYDGQGNQSRTSGTMYGSFIVLEAGMVCRGLSMIAAGAAVGTTLRKFGLYDASFNRVAQSGGETAAWGTGDLKTLSFTAPYTVPARGIYYAAVLEAGGAVPAVYGSNNTVPATINALLPRMAWTMATADMPALAVPVTTAALRSMYAVISGDPA